MGRKCACDGLGLKRVEQCRSLEQPPSLQTSFEVLLFLHEGDAITEGCQGLDALYHLSPHRDSTGMSNASIAGEAACWVNQTLCAQKRAGQLKANTLPSFGGSVRGSGQVARTCSSRGGRPDLRERLRALYAIRISFFFPVMLQTEFLHISAHTRRVF